ncbi:hypothetical protein MCHI_002260 [Candidatus Magnetoovum chiemensis]|nr:hypothetical protein MCHI_002260 [Candidatus Magnetoovum chiemensis]
MVTNDKWYVEKDKSSPLSQGEIIKDCPILIPPSYIAIDGDKVEVEELLGQIYNIIVLSQSCDLQHSKLTNVLVCPIWELSRFADNNSYYKSYKAKEELRRGIIPGYHLMNKCEIIDFNDYIVADFRNVYSIDYNFLIELSNIRDNKRICLLSPYLEHLSQAFARFFMRVGLPSDIEPFTKNVKLSNIQP